VLPFAAGTALGVCGGCLPWVMGGCCRCSSAPRCGLPEGKGGKGALSYRGTPCCGGTPGDIPPIAGDAWGGVVPSSRVPVLHTAGRGGGCGCLAERGGGLGVGGVYCSALRLLRRSWLVLLTSDAVTTWCAPTGVSRSGAARAGVRVCAAGGVWCPFWSTWFTSYVAMDPFVPVVGEWCVVFVARGLRNRARAALMHH
jgi:hypothetical protein